MGQSPMQPGCSPTCITVCVTKMVVKSSYLYCRYQHFSWCGLSCCAVGSQLSGKESQTLPFI